MPNIDSELDRQCTVLLEHPVPNLAGPGEDAFLDAVNALRPALRQHVSGEASPARVPFVLVLAGAANDMPQPNGKSRFSASPGGRPPGVLDRNHGAEGLAPYRPIDEVGPPPAPAYALIDVERGEEFRGTPS